MKCKVKKCPNDQFRSSIHDSDYCGDHLDKDPNLKSFTMEEADDFYRKMSGQLTNEDIDWLEEQLDPSIDDGYTQSVIDKLERLRHDT